MKKPSLSTGSTILFAGDSITDCGHDPSGEVTPWSQTTGLGRGYVGLIQSWLFATRPRDKIRVINRGMSGRTVRDLAANWEGEVLKTPPDWLSIMIGINDVWRRFDTPTRKDLHVPYDEYRTKLGELVAQTRPKVKNLVLVTPYIIEPNRSDPMRVMMDRYGAVVRDLAKTHRAVFVDTQAAFDTVMRFRHPMEIGWDRIHPDLAGHTIIARAWMQATDLI